MPRRYLIDVPGGEEEEPRTISRSPPRRFPTRPKYIVFFSDPSVARTEFEKLSKTWSKILLIKYRIGGRVSYKSFSGIPESAVIETTVGIGTNDPSIIADWSHIIVDQTDFDEFEVLADSRKARGDPETRDHAIADLMYTASSMDLEQLDILLRWMRPIVESVASQEWFQEIFNLSSIFSSSSREVRLNAIDSAARMFLPLHDLKRINEQAFSIFNGEFEAEEMPSERRELYYRVEELTRDQLIRLWEFMAIHYPWRNAELGYPLSEQERVVVPKREFIDRILAAARQMSVVDVADVNGAIDDLTIPMRPEPEGFEDGEDDLPPTRRYFVDNVEGSARPTLVRLFNLVANAYPRLQLLTVHPINLETVARRTLINRLLSATAELSLDEIAELNLGFDDIIAEENQAAVAVRNQAAAAVRHGARSEELKALIVDAISQQIGEMDPDEPMDVDSFLQEIIEFIKERVISQRNEWASLFEQGGLYPPVEWGAMGSADTMISQIYELMERLSLDDLEDLLSFAEWT